MSCTVADGPGIDERTITCEDGTSVVVSDGTPGRNALAGGPGLRMDVREAGVNATDRRPFVVVRFTDASATAGRPLDRAGVFTQGSISTGFTIAYLAEETRTDGSTFVAPYVSYFTRDVTVGTRTGTQPTADSGGTWTEVDAADGVYRYDFGNALPDTYDATRTHRIGAWATRTFEAVRYVANAAPTFRPDGAAVTVTRDIVSDEGCATCHNALAFHGGSRRSVDVCVTCHGPGFTDPDTGNSIEFTSMIHRIHRGEHLPSVEAGQPWEIIGYGGTVFDFSEVVFPQDIRNCEVCHAGPDGDRWSESPRRAACASCHDDRWFATLPPPPPAWMRAHTGGLQPDDTRCTGCHDSATIVDYHATKWDEPTAAVPEITIHSATLTPVARTITLDFSVAVNGTPRDLLGACPTGQVCTTAPGTATSPSIATSLSSLSAIISGPTTDYLFNASRTLTNPNHGTITPVTGTPGRFTWTSVSTVDEIAAAAIADPLRTTTGITTEGTWAIGVQATLNAYAATGPACSGTTTTTCGTAPVGGSWACVSSVCTERFTYAAQNKVAYFALTDTTVVPRRQVVSIDRCNACHEQLAFHGGGRNNPELCVMCHNSTFDSIDRMPAPAGEQVLTNSASFAYFVHRIHTGEHGVSDGRYYSPRPSGNWYAGGNLVDVGLVRFPADRRDCDTCHTSTATAYNLEGMTDLRRPRTRLMEAFGPLPNGTGRTILETYDMGATASACTGCHDSPGTIAHTETMTTALGVEACTACHSAGDTVGVDVVHARPEWDIR